MNGKIVTGAIGLIVVFFLLLLGMILIMPQAHTVISDANIADYIGLDTVAGAGVTILFLSVFGFSIWSLWTGIKSRSGGGGRARGRA